MQNYFDLYQLPVSFNPPPAQVKAKFYELSRIYHPDRFANAGNTEQLRALTLASENNKAYKTLTDPYATIEYILKLKGLISDDEKYTLPPAFLMEMMDINEAISDCEASPTNESAIKQAQESLASQFTEWEQAAGQLTNAYNNNSSPALLPPIKDMYFRKKYLLRIKERMAKFAASSVQ